MENSAAFLMMMMLIVQPLSPAVGVIKTINK